MVEVIENQELGTYVVKGMEGEPSVPKEYFEGDKPYEIIEAYKYSYPSSRSISDEDLDDFIRDICDEIISKWSDRIPTKAYLHVLGHLGIIHEYTENNLAILPSEFESEDVNTFKVLLHCCIGKKKNLEERIKLSESVDFEDEEASKAVNEELTAASQELDVVRRRIISSAKELKETSDSGLREKIANSIEELQMHELVLEKAVEFVRNMGIESQIDFMKGRIKLGARIFILCKVSVEKAINFFETVVEIKDKKMLKEYATRTEFINLINSFLTDKEINEALNVMSDVKKLTKTNEEVNDLIKEYENKLNDGGKAIDKYAKEPEKVVSRST